MVTKGPSRPGPPVGPAYHRGMSATITVRTRWDDCDRFGHVNNAAYLALLRDATERVLDRPGALAELVIEFRRPIPPNADVEVAVEPDPPRDGLLAAGYELMLEGTLRATARARWRVDPRAATPALPALKRDLGGRPFSWTHIVRTYEIGPDDALRPSAVLQWFEHAVYRAAERVGWDVARIREADFATLQVRHHLILDAGASGGERVTIVSRLVEMRRVSGMWHHEGRRADGALVAADRSRGAFVDLGGRVRQAPAEMIAALLRGEPDRT